MGDLTTFSRAKDWLILALIGVVFSLVGTVVADNRHRLDTVEARVQERGPVLEDHATRLVRLEEAQAASRAELSRRLERIESKLDRLQP